MTRPARYLLLERLWIERLGLGDSPVLEGLVGTDVKVVRGGLRVVDVAGRVRLEVERHSLELPGRFAVTRERLGDTHEAQEDQT